MQTYTFTVLPDHAKQRLDKVLADAVLRPGLTRTQVQRLITQGFVLINQQVIQDTSYKVQTYQIITVQEPPAVEATPHPQDIPFPIIYEDTEILVINKPAGLVVHPGAGNPDQTLVNALLAYCGDQLSGIGGVKRPGIVHRLDKGTSGLMVVAKTDVAHQALSAQFSDRSLSRQYYAVVWGRPLPPHGRIEGAIGRSPHNRQKMAIIRQGKPAITDYQSIESVGQFASLISCKLHTGRTHQIRVHLTSRGHGLVGDPLYGQTPKALPAALRQELANFQANHPDRPALHAYQLQLIHPTQNTPLTFTSPLPEDIQALRDILKNY